MKMTLIPGKDFAWSRYGDVIWKECQQSLQKKMVHFYSQQNSFLWYPQLLYVSTGLAITVINTIWIGKHTKCDISLKRYFDKEFGHYKLKNDGNIAKSSRPQFHNKLIVHRCRKRSPQTWAWIILNTLPDSLRHVWSYLLALGNRITQLFLRKWLSPQKVI